VTWPPATTLATALAFRERSAMSMSTRDVAELNVRSGSGVSLETDADPEIEDVAGFRLT